MWLAAMLAFGGAMAQADGITGDVRGKLLASGNGVMILSASGEVEWQHSTGLTHDAWLPANGNVMYAEGGSVTEVTREHKVVFQYKAAEKHGGGTYACQRMANGNTVIGENSTGKVLDVDPTGKVVFELQTSPASIGQHHNMRMARKLKNGNYLVCHLLEITKEKHLVWRLCNPKVGSNMMAVQKLGADGQPLPGDCLR